MNDESPGLLPYHTSPKVIIMDISVTEGEQSPATVFIL